jgi:uncharacterized protein YraI
MTTVAESMQLTPFTPSFPSMTATTPSRRYRSAISVAGASGFMLVLLLLSAITGLGTPIGAAAATTAEVATDVLNVRTDPGTWGDVIAQMTWGESVEVLDGPTDDGWYQVSYYGEIGWASGEYLSFGGVGSSGSGSSERWIDVDRSSQQVTLYEGDNAVASYWAVLGYDDSDDGYYATAIGTYYVYDMWSDLSWTEYGQAYITNWVGFDPERANGFHSWSMDENGNVIDGGDGPTGGCVALEPWASAEVYNFSEVGMRVEVHW